MMTIPHICTMRKIGSTWTTVPEILEAEGNIKSVAKGTGIPEDWFVTEFGGWGHADG